MLAVSLFIQESSQENSKENRPDSGHLGTARAGDPPNQDSRLVCLFNDPNSLGLIFITGECLWFGELYEFVIRIIYVQVHCFLWPYG
jgi:hypothetical protein